MIASLWGSSPKRPKSSSPGIPWRGLTTSVHARMGSCLLDHQTRSHNPRFLALGAFPTAPSFWQAFVEKVAGDMKRTGHLTVNLFAPMWKNSSFLVCDNGCSGAFRAVIDEMHTFYELCNRRNKEFSYCVYTLMVY